VRRPIVGLLAGVLLAATAGCYTYGSSPGTEVPDSGEVVRVHLTEEGAASLQSEVGVGVSQLFGRLRTTVGDSVTLAVRRSGQGRVDAFGAIRDSVAIPVSAVESWETQQFSVLRTGGVVLGAGAAVAVLTSLTVEQSGTLDRGGTDGGGGEGSLGPARPPMVGPRSADGSSRGAPVWISWSLPVP